MELGVAVVCLLLARASGNFVEIVVTKFQKD